MVMNCLDVFGENKLLLYFLIELLMYIRVGVLVYFELNKENKELCKWLVLNEDCLECYFIIIMFFLCFLKLFMEFLKSFSNCCNLMMLYFCFGCVLERLEFFFLGNNVDIIFFC